MCCLTEKAAFVRLFEQPAGLFGRYLKVRSLYASFKNNEYIIFVGRSVILLLNWHWPLIFQNVCCFQTIEKLYSWVNTREDTQDTAWYRSHLTVTLLPYVTVVQLNKKFDNFLSRVNVIIRLYYALVNGPWKIAVMSYGLYIKIYKNVYLIWCGLYLTPGN